MLARFAALGIALILSGCASAPTGPEFARAALPAVTRDQARIVIFRNYAEPTALAAMIDIDGTQVFELPQKSFAFLAGGAGKHDLRLRWPAVSGTPGWQGQADWLPGQTYYYELSGSSGNGFHFESRLALLDAHLATAKLGPCCRLITAQKTGVAEEAAPKASGKAQEHRSLPADQKASFFEAVKEGMTPDQVVALVGPPDEVASKSTGKKGTPFYFGSDTRREYWSYSGIGVIAFTRNEYTASLKVVEIKYDLNAP